MDVGHISSVHYAEAIVQDVGEDRGDNGEEVAVSIGKASMERPLQRMAETN